MYNRPQQDLGMLSIHCLSIKPGTVTSSSNVLLVEPQVTAADGKKTNQKSQTKSSSCSNTAKLTVGPYGKREYLF